MLSESMILPEVLYFGRFVRANTQIRDILLTMAMIVARVEKLVLLDCRLSIPTVAGRKYRADLLASIPFEQSD